MNSIDLNTHALLWNFSISYYITYFRRIIKYFHFFMYMSVNGATIGFDYKLEAARNPWKQ